MSTLCLLSRETPEPLAGPVARLAPCRLQVLPDALVPVLERGVLREQVASAPSP